MKKLLLSIKNYYLLLILLFIVVVLVFIYTYNSYFNRHIDDESLYIASQVELRSEQLDKNYQIILKAKETKSVTLTIKNSFNTDKKYGIWYKNLTNDRKIQITPSSNVNNVLSDENNIIEKNTTQEIPVNIKNKSDNDVQVEFGIVYTNTKEHIKKPDESNWIINKKNTISSKEYSVGDKVVLNKKSTWYVIQDSPTNDEYVVLLSDKTVKIEENAQSLDIKNNKVLFEPNDENIKFYLENTYKESLDNIIKFGEQGEIRLITLNELLAIGNYNYKDYNYYKIDTPEWLNIDTPWWTMTPYSINSNYYVHKGNIYFAKDKNKTRATLRPVIKVLKSNIKS